MGQGGSRSVRPSGAGESGERESMAPGVSKMFCPSLCFGRSRPLACTAPCWRSRGADASQGGRCRCIAAGGGGG
jgi:hypothetical protein